MTKLKDIQSDEELKKKYHWKEVNKKARVTFESSLPGDLPVVREGVISAEYRHGYNDKEHTGRWSLHKIHEGDVPAKFMSFKVTRGRRKTLLGINKRDIIEIKELE